MNETPNTFEEFPKIPRLNRECVITEKIDGTNGQIFIWDEFKQYAVDTSNWTSSEQGQRPIDVPWLWSQEGVSVAAGSRNRWVQPGKQDNAGFAGWVLANVEQLVYLGHGRHFGEWWGNGIQRNYGLKEKRFSLFNVGRWFERHDMGHSEPEFQFRDGYAWAPECCHVVPVLYRGPFSTNTVGSAVDLLRNDGSHAAPGFMKPEGVIVFHEAARHCFKVTLEKDESPKGQP